MKLSKHNSEKVWKLWVHPYANSCQGEFVNFVTKAKYDKLLREFKKLQKKQALMK